MSVGKCGQACFKFPCHFLGCVSRTCTKRHEAPEDGEAIFDSMPHLFGEQISLLRRSVTFSYVPRDLRRTNNLAGCISKRGDGERDIYAASVLTSPHSLVGFKAFARSNAI